MSKGTTFIPDNAARPRRITDLPGPKGSLLMGSAKAINSLSFHRVLEDWGRQYGPQYRFRVLRQQFLVLSDRDTIAGLMRDRPDAVRRSARTSRMLDEIGTRGLFTAEGEAWRKERKLVMRAMTPEVIHNFFPTLVALTERLRLRWQTAIDGGRPVDVLRDLKAYTLDVTIGLSMGQDINTLELEAHPLQRDIEFLFHRVARRLTTPLPYWRVPFLRRDVDHEASAAAARITQSVLGFIAQARARMERDPALRLKPSNMLEALIAARDEAGSGLTDDTVVGNAVTMVFAGEDTTSNTSAWLIDFLSRDARAAGKMAAEADQVLGERAVLDDYRLLERLDYIDAATREAMRLKPVAPLLALEPVHDMLIGDLLVPAGTTIFTMSRLSTERGGGIDQPDQFLPERWLAGAGESADDPGRKMFPFGAGPRFCPGRYLAMVEIKMAMSMMMRHFIIEPIENAPLAQETFTFTMTPDCLPVRLRARSR